MNERMDPRTTRYTANFCIATILFCRHRAYHTIDILQIFHNKLLIFLRHRELEFYRKWDRGVASLIRVIRVRA
jgi:hypothetical protein